MEKIKAAIKTEQDEQISSLWSMMLALFVGFIMSVPLFEPLLGKKITIFVLVFSELGVAAWYAFANPNAKGKEHFFTLSFTPCFLREAFNIYFRLMATIITLAVAVKFIKDYL